MKGIIPGVDIVTTGEEQSLDNKTLTSPVIQGVVNSGSGLTLGTVNMGATTVTTLRASGNTNVATFGASGVANFNSNVGVVGTTKLDGTLAVYGVSTFNTNVILKGTFSLGTNATLTANGLALNANYYIAIKDLTGTVYYLPCANAVW